MAKSTAARRRQRQRRNARSRGLTGNGDYADDVINAVGRVPALSGAAAVAKEVKSAVSALKKFRKAENKGEILRSTGGRLGGLMGMPRLGRAMGAGLSKIMGHGDYVPKVNSIYHGTAEAVGPPVPFFSNSGRHGVRVVEREYVGDIVTGTNGAFTIQTFRVNPGLNSTFPWLSTLANSYDEWEPLGMMVEFVSTSASYGGGSNQALGAVVIGADYDVLDAQWTSLIQMQNNEFSCSTRSSENLCHFVECATSERGRRVLFTRAGAPPNNSTLMDYDLCNIQVATAGSPSSGVNIG
jgi:hypothetical protein